MFILRLLGDRVLQGAVGMYKDTSRMGKRAWKLLY